jgi:hypothetical protein
MARRVALKRPDPSSYRGWGFVFVAGIVLAVLALIDRGGLDERTADGSSGCRFEVVAEELDVRAAASSGAELVEILGRGEVVDGTRIVVDGFRELGRDRWAADRFLTPLPGTNCG